MAKVSKERYLVLLVEDASDNLLHIRMAVGREGHLRFIGSASKEDDCVACLHGVGECGNRVCLPLSSLLLLELMQSRKGACEMLEWLQSQPFEDMIVMVLPRSQGKAHSKLRLESIASHPQVQPGDPRKRDEFAKRLGHLLVRESGGK